MEKFKNHVAVIGLGFGDEGKGVVTSALCSKYPNPIVVRFSGGHQASHTVCQNGFTHEFSNFGSGTLAGVPTYWSPQCTVEPVGLLTEFNILREKGVSEECITLYIDSNCPVTTPYDIYANQLDAKDDPLMSCGVGFGRTIQREMDNVHLTFSDLFDPVILDIKLELIAEYYKMEIPTIEFLSAVNKITVDTPIYCIHRFNGKPKNFETYIYEGSQGLLLDQDIGFFPYVTRASTGAGLLSITEPLTEVYYVTRAYQTRHGAGPMTNEDIPIEIKNSDESNKMNFNQGPFRKSVLDINLLHYGLMKDRLDMMRGVCQNLVITCVDQVPKLQYTSNRMVCGPHNLSEFVKGIVLELGFDHNVYLSNSNDSTLIEWSNQNM